MRYTVIGVAAIVLGLMLLACIAAFGDEVTLFRTSRITAGSVLVTCKNSTTPEITPMGNMILLTCK